MTKKPESQQINKVKRRTPGINFGKYKRITISIALFLLLDASVLFMNFLISFEISKDAEAVNIAGRQRMLSQRIMKSLLHTQKNLLITNNIYSLSVSNEELNSASEIFNTTLIAFTQGGITTGTSGEETHLEPVTTDSAMSALQKATELWVPLYTSIKKTTNGNTSLEEHKGNIQRSVELGQEINMPLLTLMNNLTTELENVARSKAELLRLIQTIGILLAILNFFIIMHHFIRQLRESDAKISAAQLETREILDTVDEGLFLLDKDLVMGEQHSARMLSIFGKQDVAGETFNDFVRDIIPGKSVATAQSYLKLLFDKSKKQKLLGDLNPLREVPIQVSDEIKGNISKFLKFSFRRVAYEQGVEKVLATVSDITKEVTLAKSLELAEKRSSQQMEMLTTVLNTDKSVIPLFLKSSYSSYQTINSLLKQQTDSTVDYQNKANDIKALIHSVKGDASAISLAVVTDLCHECEQSINHMLLNNDLSGRDFLSLTVFLEQLISYNDSLSELFERISPNRHEDGDTGSNSVSRNWQHLKILANTIAARQNKQVEVLTAGFNDNPLNDDFAQTVNTISTQLIRNSVTHGIETPAERQKCGKPDVGNITLTLIKRNDDSFQLAITDDGAGINKNQLINKAVEKNVISPGGAELLQPHQIVALIFHPHLSTSESCDQDSGQGIGMFSVQRLINSIGGRIVIKTSQQHGTCFTINLPCSESMIETQSLSA